MSDPFAASKRSIKLKTVLITTAVVLILVTGIYLYSRSQQSSLVLQTPADSTVTLNGAPTAVTYDKNGDSIPVIAGTYRLVVTRQNYLPYTQDVSIPVGKTVTLRPVFTLMPITSSQTGATAGISFVRPVPNQKFVFYLGDNSTRMYRVDTSTQEQVAVSEQSISPITDVQWPTTANVALVTRADGVYLLELPIFNFESQLFQRVGGPGVLSPVWDPTDSNRIASALYGSNGERELILSDKQYQTIARKADLSGFTNPKLIWSPGSRFIAVLNRSADDTQNNAWIYTLATGAFTAVTSGGNVNDLSFSPDERTVLLEKNGALVLHNLPSGQDTAVTTPGLVRTSAWRTGTSFYLPDPGNNALVLQNTNGTSSTVPYSLPSNDPIKGVFYFGSTDSLVFYTEQAVYTVGLAQ